MRLSEIAEDIVRKNPSIHFAKDVWFGKRDKEYEKTLIDILMDYYINDLHLCKYGDPEEIYPEETYEAIRRYLSIRKEYKENNFSHEELLEKYKTELGIYGHSFVQYGILQFMMYILESKHYTCCVNNIKYCYLTKKGEMFLDVLNAWHNREYSE